MLEKNQRIPLEITGLTTEGSGVGRFEGMAVFVPFSAPGDRLEVHLVKVLKNLAYGKIVRVVEPSPLRREPACPLFGRCGGCSLQHLSYEGEVAIKTGWVEENLRRIGGVELPVGSIPSPASARYRNKAQFPVGEGPDGLFCGFYSGRSHRIVPCADCLLQPAEFAPIVRAILDVAGEQKVRAYNEETGQGLLRHIYLRRAESTGQIMVCLVVTRPFFPQPQQLVERVRAACPQVSTLLLNVNPRRTNVILGKEQKILWGSGLLHDTLCGIGVDISPLSFYQVNHDAAQLLYREARRMAGLTGRELLLDLYCGAGTIGLSMAGDAAQLIGVEIIPQAVENARENAKAAGIQNARFLCADAGQAAAQLAAEGLRPQVAVVDPPRKGCDLATLDALARMAPDRIVMISCNSATAARDLNLLAQRGYRAVEAKAVDLFPRTAHVETVVLLSKGEIDSKKVRVEFSLEDMDMSGFQNDATYGQIKERVLEQTGLKVSSLYIAQIKQKYGIIERENYNKPKSENARQPKCPPEKEAAITEALRYFQMI